MLSRIAIAHSQLASTLLPRIVNRRERGQIHSRPGTCDSGKLQGLYCSHPRSKLLALCLDEAAVI